MKRKLSIMLATVMVFSIVSSSALAAESSNVCSENLIFTVTTTAYSEDETGQLVIDERTSSTEVISSQDFSASDGIMPLNVGYRDKTKTASYEGGNIVCKLETKFEYEAGSYVRCYYKKGSVPTNKYNWTITDQSTTTQYGTNESWVIVTYTVRMKTTAGVPKAYCVQIQCSRAGVIS